MVAIKNGLHVMSLILLSLMGSGICQAQFMDAFDKEKIEGWFFFTGDGDATMDFVQKEGYARILVDATEDKHNVYWTLIKRDVTSFLDLDKLKEPGFELRVEAKVQVGSAPRRINMMVNTQRTTNYHEHLMEFDIPDTTGWHTVSMTTKHFDAVPGDTVYVQLCVTDWGLGQYHVDLDYYRADVVNIHLVGPDKGALVPYHPPVPEVNTFTHHLDVAHDSVINSDFPEVNFNDWHVEEKGGRAHILTVSAHQWAILRWDFASTKPTRAAGPGLLELTTQSLPQGGDYIGAWGEDFGMEFGKVRVIEILGGDPGWEQNRVTFNSFMQDRPYPDMFNTQMIFDAELSETPGAKNFITLSQPVLQRLLEGTTKGLLIRPLGALNASFYASENQTGHPGPKLHFNTQK